MNSKQSRKTVLVVLFLFLISSCTPYTQFSIQVLEPAPVTLPLRFKSVAFINRTNSLSEEEMHRNESEISHFELFVLDSVINNKFFEGLITGIRELPRFGEVTMEIISDRRSDSSGITDILDSTQLREMKKSISGDALISLEDYSAKDSIRIYYNDYEETWQVYLEIILKAVWLVYDLQADKTLDYYIQRDTMSWYDDQYFLDDAISSMPRLLEAFREAAFSAGYKYSRRIIPGWYDTDRYLYCSGPQEMQQAARLAIAGEWNGAAAIWKELTRSGKARTAAKASFNLAVNCEGEDDLKQALMWAEKSFEIYPDKPAMDYINLLLLRELKKSRLSEQLPVGPPDE